MRTLFVVALCLSCAPRATSTAPLATDSPWPKFRRDLPQTGRAAAKPVTGGRAFSFQTAKGLFSSPVIGGDGTVYIGSADRRFYAIDRTGAERWHVQTGEIIDSSGLLDDTGAVYFGSGDGVLRAVDAKSGELRWSFAAEDPKTTRAIINWFEGNVGIGPDGTLYAGNDNFRLYAVDRATGKGRWRFTMPDQTWSLPAIDEAGALYVGNLNLVDLLGDNVFSIGPDGKKRWSFLTGGSIAASPALVNGLVVLGSFDGSVRAWDAQSGELKWEFATRDHLYASPLVLADGRIVQASTDGTVYCLDGRTGELVWTFEASEPIRSSPAADGDGNIVFGSGDGRLYVLTPQGTLKWAMQLIDDDRNDLNGSAALGNDAIVIGGENGVVHSVPYDFCPASKDPRCITPTPPDMSARAELRVVTGFGAVSQAPPPMGTTEPLTLELFVFDGTRRALATLDTRTLEVTSPGTAVTTRVTGDGRYLVLEPSVAWAPAASVRVKASYLVNPMRTGLKLSGGTVGGQVDQSLALSVSGSSGRFTVPTRPGAPQTLWEISRLALPTPTLLPSYNQIGFDSLHYVLTPIDGTGDDAVAVMVGARLAEGSDVVEVDPTTRGVIPLRLRQTGGALVASLEAPLSLEVMNLTLKFASFRLAGSLPEAVDGPFRVRLTGSTTCATVPTYGVFLQKIGLCNPMTDELTVSGAANVKQWAPTVSDDVTRARATAPSVKRTGAVLEVDVSKWNVAADKHLVSLVPVETATRRALQVDLGLATQRTLSDAGLVQTVSLEVPGSSGKALRVHVLLDAQLVATLDAP